MNVFLHTLTNQKVLVVRTKSFPNLYTVYHVDEFGDICGKELVDQFELDSDYAQVR